MSASSKTVPAQQKVIEDKPTFHFVDTGLCAKKKIQTQDQMTVHKARAMVLSCMDFRLLDNVVHFMNNSGYNKNYDQFILAGASLGFQQKNYEEWGKSFIVHLDVAIKLHDIKEIICIDHDKCGAYKVFNPQMKPEEEHDMHVENLLNFQELLNESHPQLTVHTFIMYLDGRMEKVEKYCTTCDIQKLHRKVVNQERLGIQASAESDDEEDSHDDDVSAAPGGKRKAPASFGGSSSKRGPAVASSEAEGGNKQMLMLQMLMQQQQQQTQQQQMQMQMMMQERQQQFQVQQQMMMLMMGKAIAPVGGDDH